MTREEAQLKRNVISLEPCFVQDAKMCNLINKIFDEHEAQLKAKDDEIRRLNNLYADTIKDLGDAFIEIERLKKAIDTSIEEIEYAINKPQYAKVYLGNAIRFLKDNK